jgi:hypothetical protein
MAGNTLLEIWVVEALTALGGQGSVVQISRHIRQNPEPGLRAEGNLFYTWQYAMRWAAQRLQHEGKLSKSGKNRMWYLTP